MSHYYTDEAGVAGRIYVDEFGHFLNGPAAVLSQLPASITHAGVSVTWDVRRFAADCVEHAASGDASATIPVAAVRGGVGIPAAFTTAHAAIEGAASRELSRAIAQMCSPDDDRDAAFGAVKACQAIPGEEAWQLGRVTELLG